MELSSFARTVHLGDLTDLVLSDLGASVQIFRAANRECEPIEGHFSRIEDCISSLGVEACFEAISQESSATDGEQLEIRQAWLHARDIAWKMYSIAEQADSGIRPSEAYFVGLFHELETLPALMRWNTEFEFAAKLEPTGLRLAQAWSLPDCVLDYFAEIYDSSERNKWSKLLAKAHSIQNPLQFRSAPAFEQPSALFHRESIQPVAF